MTVQKSGVSNLMHDVSPKMADWFSISPRQGLQRNGSRGRSPSILHLIALGVACHLLAGAVSAQSPATVPVDYGISIQGIAADSCDAETVRYLDKSTVSIVKSVYGHLDFDALSKLREATGYAKALVPMGPVIAAGEGEHPDNHTVVRILNKYQLREAQFLAYPPKVRGGVGIETVTLDSRSPGFVCYPLVDKETNSLRVFNRYGGLVREIRIPDEITPPFVVAVGSAIAVASRFQPGPVQIYSVTGTTLKTIAAPINDVGTAGIHLVALKTNGSVALVYQDIQRKVAYMWQAADGFTRWHDVSALPDGARLFASAFPSAAYNAGLKQDLVSTLYSVNGRGQVQPYDVGLRENSFYYYLARQHGKWRSEWPRIMDSKYVREIGSLGPFFQAQDWSPLVKTGDIKNRSRTEWLKGMDWGAFDFLQPHLRQASVPFSAYTNGPMRAATSPNFSHRWGIKKTKALAEQKGADGLPEYLALDRNNKPNEGGYFGEIMFTYGSYNFEQPELSDFYGVALGEYYRQLAKVYRTKADNLLLAKPSHENEVMTGKGSLGDYNSNNIRGFYRYLLAMYGSRETINQHFGTDFTENRFDPPRNLKRGTWDGYSIKNPLFQEWIEYNRINVYRRVGEALLGVVMAGIPPQLTRTHQIPDYAVGGTIGIGDNAARITPVDWLLTAGTGFGYTQYGLWYQSKANMAQGAWSSGFDDVFIGEYASKAKTAQGQQAWEQLKYAVEHGIKGVQVMSWPDEGLTNGFNETQYAALQRLHQEYGNTPLPGMAGGISQVRAYTGKSGTYNIAALGCTDRNTGLLKSLNADGSFEGTVYVAPFHAHVDVSVLAEQASLVLSPEPSKLCALKDIRQGCLVEINFTLSRGQGSESIETRLYHAEVELPGQRTVLKKIDGGMRIRIVYKFPIIMGNVSIALVSPSGSLPIDGVQVYRHQDQSANLTLAMPSGQRHQGGVQFAIIGE